MTNIRVKSSPELASGVHYVKETEEEECCCEVTDTEPDTILPVVSPTIEDFINIIEESKVLEDRNLSLQLILLVDVFIEMHLYKNAE